MKRLFWLLIPAIFLLISFRQANYHRVAGTINGVVGNPIINAVISEKGKSSKNTVTTDAQGKYSIRVSSSNATIVISAFRYITTQVEVKGRKTINLILTPAQEKPLDRTP